jgi:tRNA A-37 threonylcarbamoyl transferase component Bud32
MKSHLLKTRDIHQISQRHIELIAMNVSQALSSLHSQPEPLSHGNVTLDNILIESKNHSDIKVVLGDYGECIENEQEHLAPEV